MYKVINAFPNARKIEIYYLTTHTRNDVLTNALVYLDDRHHALTYFCIPNDDRNRSLTIEAYACLIPVLYCTTFIYNAQILQHIYIHCNTKQLQKRLIMSTNPRQSPCQTYIPDWDLTHAIGFNTNKFNRTSFVQYNRETSDRLDTLLDSTEIHQDTQSWIQTTSSYSVPQLQIRKTRVPSDYTTALREEHTSHAIFSYYIDKYEWNQSTIADILWAPHGKALTSLPKRMTKTITQFLHLWLPLNTSHSTKAIVTGKLCPFCASCDEDHHHFLSCSHPK
jgi:hypothetical protein